MAGKKLRSTDEEERNMPCDINAEGPREVFYNEVEVRLSQEVRLTLKKIGDLINESGNSSANTLFDAFIRELNEPYPERSKLRQIGNDISRILPPISGKLTYILNISKKPCALQKRGQGPYADYMIGLPEGKWEEKEMGINLCGLYSSIHLQKQKK